MNANSKSQMNIRRIRASNKSSNRRLNLEKLELRQLLAFNIADDFFSLAADASLNVLTNDSSAVSSQNVSAKNVQVDKLTADRAANTADNFIPDVPGQPGVPQRSVFPGAVTLVRSQANYGDVDLYVDLDADPTNDTLPIDPSDPVTLARLNLSQGIVLGTLVDNSELNPLDTPPGDAAGTNLAVVQYVANAAGDAWIATNASPENRGEQAANFSSAYFPYAAGWRGASFNGETQLGGDVGITAVGGAGDYEITVAGVTDSFNDGFLFAIGGDNVDNYTRTLPLGGNRWRIIHRDNSNGIDQTDTAADQQRFNLLYVPRSAKGLVGGTVNGRVADANPLRQSFGDFDIQRQSDGIWKLTVPGQSIASGVVVLETADASNSLPRNTYFTYDVDPSDAQSILIRQFDYNRPVADLANEDFTFFFIPFSNELSPTTDISVTQLGSSVATLGNNISSNGIPLSLNADGTVNYNTGTAILALGQGNEVTDSFVYEAVAGDGSGGQLTSSATVTVLWRGVNDSPVAVGQPTALEFQRNGAPVNLNVSSFFSDPDTLDTLTYSATFSAPGVATSSVSGNVVTLQPVANASGTVDLTITATDPYGVSAAITTTLSVIGINLSDDSFFVTGDATLSVLNNDKSGFEVQNISAINVTLTSENNAAAKTANTATYAIFDRPGQPGVPQRSVYAGATTITNAGLNYGDVNIYFDQDADPSNDTSLSGLTRTGLNNGLILTTVTDNSPLDATATNLAVAQYTGSATAAFIATNAAPQNSGEQAIDFSTAYFPYSAGWIGGSYNGLAVTDNLPAVVAGGTGLTVTATGTGRYEVEVVGVTDSFNDGYLFSVGGDNSDNYTRVRPVGGNRWAIQHRDNSAALAGNENGRFNLLYIPRSATGLTGGVVDGGSVAVNSLKQSFGDFSIQRETDGFWRLSVPGHSPSSGVLILETADLTTAIPRNSYFTYDAATDNPNEFVIRQFDFISGTQTANPQNGDFTFFFIPFENDIQSSTPVTVAAVGSSVATLGDNVSASGFAISINPDGTVNYAADAAIGPLGSGQTLTDSFVYRGSFNSETDIATVTINLVGVNDAPEILTTPAEVQLVEEQSTNIDISGVFSDPDLGDSLTYSVSFSRDDVVDAVVNGNNLSITGLQDKFGVVRVTLTATDTFGATTSVVVPVSVAATADGPIASPDTAIAPKTSVTIISVLDNDLHPDAGVFQVVGANIFGNSEATGNADTIWTVDQTGSTPNNLTIVSPPDRGDLGIGVNGVPLVQNDGVLFGTIHNDAAPFGTVNAWQGGFASVQPGGVYTFATELGAGGNGERNAPLGAAFFPFAENWVGGNVAANGTLESGNGVNQSNVTKLQTGIWSVSIPGVTDSNNDGLLFVIGGANNDNFTAALPVGGNSWLVRQADNDSDSLGFEDQPFRFVYVPINTTSLIGGRWSLGIGGGEEGGGVPGIDLSTGTFTATDSGQNSVIIDIPGFSPTDGTLIVSPTGAQDVLLPDGSTVQVPVNYGAFYADTVDGKFEVSIRQGVDFLSVQSAFQFMFVPFANPLRTPLSADGQFTVTAVEPVSALGASVSINPNGTLNYDTTAAGGAIAALSPGQSVVDTFSYTITDAAGRTSIATASVTNFAPSAVTFATNTTSIAEDAGIATLTATLSTASAVDVTIDVAISGTATLTDDYTVSVPQIVIPVGSLEGSITVTAVQDTIIDPTETVIVDFLNTTNATSSGNQQFTITIADDEIVDPIAPTIQSVKVSGSLWDAVFMSNLDPAGVGYAPVSGEVLPWANINQITIQFSEPVVGFDASKFALLGINTANYSANIASVIYDMQNNRGLVTLMAPINGDRIRVAVSDLVVDAAGNSLDGDGNATAGGIFDLVFSILVGDATGEGSVNGADLTPFAASFNQSAGVGSYSAPADWNADGSVNGGDLSQFAANFNASLPTGQPGLPIFGGGVVPDGDSSGLKSVDDFFTGLSSEIETPNDSDFDFIAIR